MIEKAYILYIDEPKSVEWAQECAKSCEEHDVPFEMFKGFKGLSIEELTHKTGWVCGRPGLEKNDEQYVREYNAALGHIKIWEKIAAGDQPCAILEHDAIVKQDFTDIDMKGDVMFLGPRVNKRTDYEFPTWTDVISIKKTRRFEGLHAYVLSPTTARFLLDKVSEMKRILPSEAMLSVRNPYDMDLRVVDPPYVVCELGGRKSFTMQDEITIPQNFRDEPGFLAGLKPDAVRFKTNDYIFNEDWFSGNIKNWVELFSKFDKKKTDKLSVLEIGSYEGRATMWLLDNMMDHPESKILCVDTFKGSPEHSAQAKETIKDIFLHNVSVSKWPEKVGPIIGDSRFVLPALCREGKSFDIIYVDGSHATLDVVNDGIFALHLLKKNGLIIFDDYQWTDPIHGNQPVKKAVDFLDANFPKFMVRVLDGYQRAYRKAP